MYSEVYSVTLAGLDACIVKVETDAGDGLPSFEMSGCLAAQVTEARERVRVAVKNSGIILRPQKIMVNISPADIRKAGNGFDLPVAAGILAADGIIKTDMLESSVIIGELSLDGSVNAVRGIINCVAKAAQMGFKRCIVPSCNICEGEHIAGIEVLGVDSLKQLIGYFNGESELIDAIDAKKSREHDVIHMKNETCPDFADITGQITAKRASLIAAAGHHNICYMGIPGTGKTMMAKRISTIMLPLNESEKMELTRIYSAAGKLEGRSIIEERPVRCPNYNTTKAVMLGGGVVLSPGEITLADKGILFLDEFNEFASAVIDSLRTPLEEHIIRIVRGSKEYIYPADFMLVAAMNPCRCGYYPDRNRCSCTEHDIKRYMSRVSKPIWDRIDICTHMGMIDARNILYESDADKSSDFYTTANMKKCVKTAYDIQKERFSNENIEFNSQMNEKHVKKYCRLGQAEKRIMETAFERLNLTVRGYHKVLKTARTIADIEGEECINAGHLSEAFSYRNPL